MWIESPTEDVIESFWPLKEVINQTPMDVDVENVIPSASEERSFERTGRLQLRIAHPREPSSYPHIVQSTKHNLNDQQCKIVGEGIDTKEMITYP